MSTPNGAKVRKLRRTLITSAVIVGLAVIAVFANRSSQAWQRDVDRSFQSVHQSR